MHLDTGRRRDVRRRDHPWALLAQVHHGRVVVLGADDQFLEVQDQVGDVLFHAWNRGEFVQHPIDTDAGHRRTGDRGQQSTAKRVAEGVAEPRLKRFDDKPGAELGDRLLGQRRTLCNEHR